MFAFGNDVTKFVATSFMEWFIVGPIVHPSENAMPAYLNLLCLRVPATRQVTCVFLLLGIQNGTLEYVFKLSKSSQQDLDQQALRTTFAG